MYFIIKSFSGPLKIKCTYHWTFSQIMIWERINWRKKKNLIPWQNIMSVVCSLYITFQSIVITSFNSRTSRLSIRIKLNHQNFSITIHVYYSRVLQYLKFILSYQSRWVTILKSKVYIRRLISPNKSKVKSKSIKTWHSYLIIEGFNSI